MINVYLCAQRRLHLNPSYEGKRSRDSLLSPSPNFGQLPYWTTISCCMLMWRFGFPSPSLVNWISLEIHLNKPFAGNELTKVSRVFISGFDPLHILPFFGLRNVKWHYNVEATADRKNSKVQISPLTFQYAFKTLPLSDCRQHIFLNQVAFCGKWHFHKVRVHPKA